MIHDSRFHRSFVSAPWRQLAHVGVLVIVVICIVVCSAHRTEHTAHSATGALMLTPLDALIHASVLQAILILVLVGAGLCWAVWRTIVSLRAPQTLSPSCSARRRSLRSASGSTGTFAVSSPRGSL